MGSSISPPDTSAVSRPRRVLVTGAASGIGRSTAVRLARAGSRVVAWDVDDAAGTELAEEARGQGWELAFRHVDVSREEDVVAALREAADAGDGIDTLVHAAGIMAGQLEDIRDLTEATWDRVVDVNLKGAFLVAKHVATVMLAAGSGVIILIASKGGVSTGSGSYPYGASKGGMHGLSLTLDRHLGPQGIRINEVCPGDVDTPLMHRSLTEGLERGGDPQSIERIRRGLTAPDAIAELIAFLASEAASCVRGTVFTT